MGQVIAYCPPVTYCPPPPMPICRPQPAPWSYSPAFRWNPPYNQPCQCGCGGGAPCTCQPVPTFGPIIGVTDGQPAQPGQVGEFLQASSTQSWNVAIGATQTQTVSALVVQPGDWDISGQMQVNLLFSGAYFQMLPAPVGLSGVFAASLFVTVPSGPDVECTLVAPRCQILCSVPTLLPVQLSIVNGTGAAQTGQTGFFISARRMR